MHSDQTELCVSYDFSIAFSRAPIVKAPKGNMYLSIEENARNDEIVREILCAHDMEARWHSSLGIIYLTPVTWV